GAAPTGPSSPTPFVCLAQILQVLACRSCSASLPLTSFAALPSSPTSTSSLLHLTSFHLHPQATFPSSALDFDHHFPSQHAKTIFGLHDTRLVARQARGLAFF